MQDLFKGSSAVSEESTKQYVVKKYSHGRKLMALNDQMG